MEPGDNRKLTLEKLTVLTEKPLLFNLGSSNVSASQSKKLDEKELADTEQLLIETKPHLFAISSDIQPSVRSGDATLAMAWSGDGKQLNTDMPEVEYILGKEGGELWSDYYAIPKGAEHLDAAYALINYMLDPAVNTRKYWRMATRPRMPKQKPCCPRHCKMTQSSTRHRSCWMRLNSARR